MISIDLTKIKRFRRISFQAIKRILHPAEIEDFLNLDKTKKTIFLATR
ncbi:Uncharacterised protein [Mycoplasmopsis arginini]|nr:Uncharacterised protein [Chlamydia abortus]SGA05730.1 Uncharacterised protein [Mycoplasmopsis arginini]SGA10988.1 Uncharacterised protein [Mycoplasmopsis arginini]SGA32209.1 Uncharacterised protein [Chlamydia abortus]